MSDETRQAVRDCAAIAELVRLRVMINAEGMRLPQVAEKVRKEIERKWPEAFKDGTT